MSYSAHKYKLSICIPTYNYGIYLEESLRVLVAEDGFEQCEVVIGDGGSSDNTHQIANQFIRQHANIKYMDFEKKGGIDVDLDKTASFCQGEYIWFLSADDVPVKGAVKKILFDITSNPACILYERIICDYAMKVRKVAFWSNKHVPQRVSLSNNNEFVEYLSSLNSIGGLFSFMSVIVVRRDDWNSEYYPSDLVARNYQHVIRLFRILLNVNSHLEIPAHHIVYFRGDNDSFASAGDFNRLMIDLRGYKRIALLFKGVEVPAALKKVMQYEHRWYYLPKFLLKISTKKKRLVFGYLRKFGYSYIQIHFVLFVSKFSFLIDFLRITRRILVRTL